MRISQSLKWHVFFMCDMSFSFMQATFDCLVSAFFKFWVLSTNMANILKEADAYNSSDDEDYVPPVDAPEENENDAYLIEKEDIDATKPSEPTK